MEYLKKEEIFFERDGEGKLLPIDVVLDTLTDKPMIRVVPLNKGELSKVISEAKDNTTDIDTDINIIINQCKNPSFTEDDRELLKSAGKAVFTNAISLAILSISTGTSQKEILEAGKQKVIENSFQ